MKSTGIELQMIMRSMFKNPIAKVLVLCLGLGTVGVGISACSSREQRAQAYYERGKGYLEQKDYVKARIELRNALQLKDDLLPAWKAMAQIDEQEQNIAGLASDLRRIVEIDATDLDATTKLARLSLLGNALDQGLKLANAAAELDPKSADVKALKAAILFRLKDPEGAMQTAQQALAIDPGNAGANAILAGVRFSQGDSDGALKALNNVSKDHAEDLGVVSLKINVLTQRGELGQAEALLRRLIELNPKVPQFRTQLIQFYLTNKRPDDAVNELRSVVKANPDDVNAELQLVGLLASVKGANDARAELTARIGAGGNVFPYQIALAKFDYAQGRPADTIKRLEQLIASPGSAENGVTARTALAEIYLSRNEAAAAEPLIAEILKTDSHNTNALRFRAGVALDRGKTDDAIADLRTALNYQPRSPELLASLAIAYERSGAIELADKSFFDATKASNYNPVIGLSYLTFLRRRGMGSQAEGLINELANRNQSNVPVLATLAQIKLEKQDWAGAHAVADAIKKLDGKSDVASQIDAAAFSGQGKVNDSLAVLQSAYQANPNAVRPMVDLVSIYVRSGQIPQAESFIRSVLKDNPNNAEALVLLGYIQTVKKAPAEAEQSFKTAIAKKPNDAAGYRALAELYMRDGKRDTAMDVVREGLKNQPGNFALQLLQAGLLETKKDYDGAIAQYEAMLKDTPSSLVVANNLASLLTDHRADKSSLERADALAAVLKNSQLPQFKDTLGWIRYQRQDYRSALPLLEDAAKALPNVAMVRYHLGMAYLSTGQEDKAGEQFKQARTLAAGDAELLARIDAALKSPPPKAKG